VIKNENYCVSYIVLSLIPNSNPCIIYYYEAMEVIGENENHFVKRNVKKGDLIGYTNSKGRLKPSIQNNNVRGCK
jgi:hypothetical protein